MNLEQLYFIAEIIAALAVIISIIYLGVQIRNTRIQNKKEMYLDMSKFRSELTLKLASDKGLSYIVAQGLSAKSKMTPNEYFRFSNFAFAYFIGYEVAFQRNQSNDMDDDIAKGLKDSLNWWLSLPGVQVFWKNNSEFGFSNKFKNYINKSINEVNKNSKNQYQNHIEFMASAGERIIAKTEILKDEG
ncbi:hypothetical protein [uncultured Algibacter sp.]|uniref:hypothetical protein n=1 Tax=uncultured Algibacter sp. TaxID=298659 RepID=UPI0030ED76F0|tara:strand:- start:55 stop:618 length:564 start_codon:yes stop_codon:yes gene_type:complete